MFVLYNSVFKKETNLNKIFRIFYFNFSAGVKSGGGASFEDSLSEVKMGLNVFLTAVFG